MSLNFESGIMERSHDQKHIYPDQKKKQKTFVLNKENLSKRQNY